MTIVYFSFITLTSTGYGDVVPQGILKLLSIMEIFFGLVVFGFLISKLISTRQQKIIEELYDISFEEKVNKLRSSLYAYRSNLSRMSKTVKVTRYGRKAGIITELEANLEGMKSSITRIRLFLMQEKKKSISKVNEITLNLLFNGLNLSVSSITKILVLLNERRYDWKQEKIINYINSSVRAVNDLLETYNSTGMKDELKGLINTLEESVNKLEEFIE